MVTQEAGDVVAEKKVEKDQQNDAQERPTVPPANPLEDRQGPHGIADEIPGVWQALPRACNLEKIEKKVDYGRGEKADEKKVEQAVRPPENGFTRMGPPGVEGFQAEHGYAGSEQNDSSLDLSRELAPEDGVDREDCHHSTTCQSEDVEHLVEGVLLRRRRSRQPFFLLKNRAGSLRTGSRLSDHGSEPLDSPA